LLKVDAAIPVVFRSEPIDESEFRELTVESDLTVIELPDVEPPVVETPPPPTADRREELDAPLPSVASAASIGAPASIESPPLGWDELTPASPIDNPPPVYPPAAAARGWQGRVTLRLHIAADGAVEAVDLVATSGHRELDDAALRAVEQWRFVPARRAGQPVAWSTLLPVRFRAR
jgi:periplasmic protein TonB